jgi:endonuclease YncB( thermonuclease family)
MSRRSLRRFVSVVVPLVLVLAAAWLGDDLRRGPGRPGPRPPRAEPGRSAEWVRLDNPSPAGDPADDGDSFVVVHAGGRSTLRLYFIDCPEKRRHQFNGPRLADQGAYFGGLTESETIRIGRDARDFTLGLLRSGPVTVFTRWERVFDDDRHYAHVEVTGPDGSRRWLAELLVENGLGRIYTKGEDLPDGTPAKRFAHHLRSLEKSARLARRGGWAAHEGGPD